VNARSRSLDDDAVGWIPTRESLLSRIRRWDDKESWRDFFNTYWKLIYRAATKAGLSDGEAQEVVQETVIVVAKKMEHFKYDPAKDSFKGWLLYLTRKQVAAQYRNRQRGDCKNGRSAGAAYFTADLESIPDPSASALETIWDQEWERNLMDAAIASVLRAV
jgi:RNA polymerase sigma-70 factor (ECF subfamily)